jgi:hypothetical protein
MTVATSLAVAGLGMLIGRKIMAMRYDPNEIDPEERRRIGQSRTVRREEMQEALRPDTPPCPGPGDGVEATRQALPRHPLWDRDVDGEVAVHVAGVKGFFRGIKRSVVAAAVLLAWDGVFCGSFVMSWIFCPIWFLVSLLKNAIERPGWGLALVRIGIPALTLALVRGNNAVQIGVAEANAQRVVAASEAYHSANGRFPKNLDELVPQYMNSVPLAKYCLGPPCRFEYYYNSGEPMLVWQVVPPYYRKIYHFHTRSWSYLD